MEYKKFEKLYTITEFCAIYSNKNDIHLKNPRFLFNYRNKFAKLRSFELYNKNYENLTLDEKFEITYLIPQRNYNVALTDFILESGFRNIHQKMQLNNSLNKKISNEKISQMLYKEEINNEKQKNKMNILKSVLQEKLKYNHLCSIYLYRLSAAKSQDVINNFYKDPISFYKKLINSSNLSTIIDKMTNRGVFLYNIIKKRINTCKFFKCGVVYEFKKNNKKLYNEYKIAEDNIIKSINVMFPIYNINDDYKKINFGPRVQVAKNKK